MPDDIHKKLSSAVQDLNVMPSMRALMTAGAPLDICHVPSYNCSYMTVDTPRVFDECMYILMCGTGVGFSVEKKYTEKLPIVNEELHHSDTVIKVRRLTCWVGKVPQRITSYAILWSDTYMGCQ